MARRVAPPPGLGTAGRELWRSCLIRDESLTDSDNPMREVVLEAARLADSTAKLHEIVVSEGVLSGSRVHPALTAWRRSTTLRTPAAGEPADAGRDQRETPATARVSCAEREQGTVVTAQNSIT